QAAARLLRQRPDDGDVGLVHARVAARVAALGRDPGRVPHVLGEPEGGAGVRTDLVEAVGADHDRDHLVTVAGARRPGVEARLDVSVAARYFAQGPFRGRR